MEVKNVTAQSSFFLNKSVLRSYNYYVVFHNRQPFGSNFYVDFPKSGEEFIVRSVKLPQYEFKREVIKYGPFPFTYPVLETDGLEIQLTLEETNKGSITRMIEQLKMNILDQNGRYYPQVKNRFGLDVVVTDHKNNNIFQCKYEDCYFLKASELNMDYYTNEAVSYDLSIAADIMSVEFIK